MPSQIEYRGIKEYLDLLRSLGYDAALFERCIALMVPILLANDMNEQAHGTQLFTSLFHLCLSGTRATIEQRLKVIELLLASPDEKRRSLGAKALGEALEAWQFQASATFDFGARSRDFGYWPHTNAEVHHWFTVTLELVTTLASSDTPAAAHARAALAERFRGLWHRGGVPEELAKVCAAMRQHRFWPEGWLAVRQTLDFDGKRMDPERLVQLKAIEAQLRPTDLLQKVRSAVFSTRLQGIDLDAYDEDDSTEDIGTRMARTEVLARDLGKTVASEEAALQELLPELVSNEGRLCSFGQGLFAGAADALTMWNHLVTALAATDEPLRKPQVLLGFLHALHANNPALAATLLDNAMEHETLKGLYPYLQVAFDIGAQDVARLKRSLALRHAPAGMYIHLMYGRATDPIPAADVKELVLTIAAMPAGFDVAVEILHMRLHSEKERKAGIAPELLDAGCELMQQYTFAEKNDREDYRLGEITKSCLIGAKGAAVMKDMFRRLKVAVAKHETSAFYHDDLLVGLFGAQPAAALEGLCGGDAKDLERGIRILRDGGSRKYPLAMVPEKDLLAWCDQEPQTRYPAIAQIITAYQRTSDSSPPQWTSIALRFLERAPDPSEILKEFVAQFSPSSGWSGSLGAILASNAVLLDQLGAYPQLSAVVAEQKERLQEWIDEQKRRDTARDRQRDERFE